MQKRNLEKEYIDLGSDYYTETEYRDCLYQLGRIGKILGGDRATMLAFRSYCPNPSSILDVGCGGGNGALGLARAFPNCRVVGIDTSEEAIRYARQHAANQLSFKLMRKPELNMDDNSFDVVTATLVCHHMRDEEIVEFLRKAVRVAKKCVIINDLHRHWLAYLSFALLVPWLFPNRLIKHDGLLSIKRSFKKRDWERLLQEAGVQNHSITWRWAFRWVVAIQTG